MRDTLFRESRNTYVDRSKLSECNIKDMSSPESDRSGVVGHTASPLHL